MFALIMSVFARNNDQLCVYYFYFLLVIFFHWFVDLVYGLIFMLKMAH